MKRQRHRKGLYPQKGQKRAAHLRRRARRHEKHARFWLKVALAEARKPQRAAVPVVAPVGRVATIGGLLSSVVQKVTGRTR